MLYITIIIYWNDGLYKKNENIYTEWLGKLLPWALYTDECSIIYMYTSRCDNNEHAWAGGDEETINFTSDS